MSKDSYTRESMRENMLKKVLIRVDYEGVTDINKWILQFKSEQSLNSCFKSYNKAFHNKATFDLSNMEEIAESRSLPISVFESEPLHRFYDSCFQNREDSVEMEVTSLFLTFSITCNKYKSLDIYIDYLSEYFTKFMSSDKYIVIKRIGIRKIGGGEFASLVDVGKVFEEEIFGLNIQSIPKTMINIEHIDRFFEKDKGIKVNFSRRFRTIDDKKEGGVFQALLDLDGYVDSEIITQLQILFPTSFSKTVRSINDYLFELFKISVTEQYLSNHGEIKN